MIPKKPKQIVKIVSEELDLSQELVDDLTTFYYKTLRNKLSELEELRVNAPGLGHFLIRNSAVTSTIKRFELIKNSLGDATFSNYHKRKLVQARLDKLYNIKEKIQEFLEKKKEFKETKYGKQDQANLEKPERDI
jgi:hypothetical protein